MEKQITVLAANSQEELESRGAEIEFTFDTVAEAKKRAKYYLTEEYRLVSESSRCLGYAKVLVNGECVADFTRSTRIEAHGVRGLASKPWRKTFASSDALCKWAERNDATVEATREAI